MRRLWMISIGNIFKTYDYPGEDHSMSELVELIEKIKTGEDE